MCPPQHTYTTLNHAIISARQKDLDDSDRQLLLEKVPEAVYDSNFESRFTELESFKEEDKYRNWYTGQAYLTSPYRTIRAGSIKFSSVT